ncbi:E1-E2 ATPase-domain-containing protein [Mycena amicta]|nr:E1-E2 ATPase-domain-containing protein [Mycena amicta]
MLLPGKTSYMDSQLTTHLTTVYVSNLHCGSCILTIEHALAALAPKPISVDVSVVSQAVSVRHLSALAPEAIQSAILQAGFDVAAPNSDAPSQDRQQRHMEQCTFCQNAKPPAEETHAESFRLTLSISGMSCSSCTNSITLALQELSGVSDVQVSLLDKSATATIDDEDLAKAAVDAVEDCGFNAQVISILAPGAARPSSDSRTISLRIDGMFCSHCPTRAMAAVEALGPRVAVLSPFPSHTNPVISISYRPNQPSITIRSIIAALESSNSPPFKVSIAKPPSLEDRAKVMHAQDQQWLLYRCIITLVVAIPTFIIGIVFMSLVHDNNPTKMYLMEPMWTGNTSRTSWSLCILALPAYFFGAGSFHRRSLKEIHALWRPGSKTPISRRLLRFGSMNLLVSIGVSVAFFASIGLLALAARQPRQERGDTTTYFDSVVFLTLFLLAGRYLEGYSKARTADAITALAGLRPVKAQLVVAASQPELVSEKPANYDAEKAYDDLSVGTSRRVVTVPLELLEIGDIVRCNTGSTPPADGTIVPLGTGEKETFTFDESMLTGESMPVVKRFGDKVYLGSVNRSHTVFIRVDRVGGGTMLDNIVAVVREGATRRAPIERLADLITGYFVPVITLLAIVTWMIWVILAYSGALPPDYLDIPIGGWVVWSLEFSIAVFVVACPCGIGLAAPTALLVGAGIAAKAGILARGGGEAFQEMSRVDIVVFDKTGTLTTGADPSVSESIFPELSSSIAAQDILGMAAALESATSHPLGRAVFKFCQEHDAKEQTASQIEETPGLGIIGRFGSTQVIVGSQAFVEQSGTTIDSPTVHRVEAWKANAMSVVFMAVSLGSSYELAAIFAVSDPIRSEAPAVVRWFKQQGITPWIISGDNAATTLAVAQQVGVAKENVIAGVLPHEKGEKIQMLQSQASSRSPRFAAFNRQKKIATSRSIVAMVGDGINDSVALTVADVGIAIGSGSDVAISSASFILLSSDLRALCTLCELSRRIMSRVRLNFAWSIVYNLAALPIAAGVIYPAKRVRLDPVWASLAMALSSISVIASSLALRLYRPARHIE